ncbi:MULTISPECIES: DUF4124 domain-containing protein [unclassified Shewanella]|uniref:DUF4124 domain-containing protein n=1 Tax=unclassified Shewanella TaxID=196818 RepID=UPI000C857BA4|nr:MULTISPECIES: DUF4124 domain-containing protein [unclassified Shewanella]MDO6640004.1 DUF4124 domain-containing protein [Shewanella sp. 5_MG-2023]MDO6678350.1 DUF4124 domain-containing protein [Shewanella sp. 4_MG-2023]MDO6775525.1 DUF4124 domain-containing protein [Shewanella sp. 3_MG-2023]PMG28191.1 hypothetical protein BCU94_04105 [Shewanella sp. 10N.286.52.C2]PMG39397.1 hypothetical protein BCU91_15235 [Shewanella sp. 10N.286.52.B9]
MLSLRLLCLIGCCSLIQVANATVIYSWVDEKGVKHYSQQPPNEVNSEKLYSEDIEPAQVGYLPVIANASSSANKPSDAEKNAETIKARDAEQAASICESAKHSLNVLNTYQRLHRKDPTTGEAVQVTEEERLAQIETNEERIKLFCQ